MKNVNEVELKIGKDGAILLGGVECSEAELSKKLVDFVSKDTILVLLSHPESKYDLTVRILDIVSKAGVKNVTFTADSEE